MIIANLRGWILAAPIDDDQSVDMRWPYSHLILFILLFCFLLSTRWSLLSSPALNADDFDLMTTLIGQPLGSGTVPLFRWIVLGLTELLRDPFLIRLVFVVILSVCGVLFFDLLRLSGLPPIDRFIIVSIATFTPAAFSQAIFILGSHPTIGLLFCLLAYRLLAEVRNLESPGQIIVLTGIAIGFFLMAQFSSSTALLLSFPVAVFAFDRQSILTRLKRLSFILAASVPPSIVFSVQWIFPSMRKSYWYIEGWIDVSVLNMISQVFRFERLLFHYYVLHDLWTNVAIICLVSLLAGFLIWWSSKLRNWFWDIGKPTLESGLGLMMVFCLLVSALSFGPTSVLTYVFPRYIVLPTFFGLSFVCLVYYAIAAKLGLSMTLVRAIGIAAIALSLTALARESTYKYYGAFKLQEDLIRFVEIEETQWQDRAQIVVMFDDTPRMFPRGFIPWSSKFLRYATSRDDINGLLGRRDWMTGDPIRSEDARWWGPAYSAVINGKLTFLKMVGLTMERSTYFYEWSAEPVLNETGYVIIDDATERPRLFAANPGETLRHIADADEETICDLLDNTDGQIPVFGPLPHASRPYCDERDAN